VTTLVEKVTKLNGKSYIIIEPCFVCLYNNFRKLIWDE